MSNILQIISKLFYFISSIIRPAKVIVFSSFPAFTDNSYAIYQHIIRQGLFKEYKLIWIVVDQNETRKASLPIGIHNDKLVILSKRSLRAIWYYLRAKYVFFTHGLYSNLKIGRQNTVINLWHGMPLKRIGLMESQRSSYMANSQVLISTNQKFQMLMAQSFGKSLNDVLIIGQPRNDLLFQPSDFYKKFKINKSDYSSVGIWLPTYRASNVGNFRVDGKYEDGKISFLGMKQLQSLDSYLEKNEMLLIVKLHPMDVLQDYDFTSLSNIKIVKQKDFKTQLYPLLGSTDFLLTDYSSVWIDYDILGKPMGFLIDDFDEYKESRGFTFENLDQEVPGKIIRNMESLEEFLSNPAKYITKTGDLFNKFKDNKASERLMKWIEEHS